MRAIILSLGLTIASAIALPVAIAQTSDAPQLENARLEKKALACFEATLKKEPNRFNATAGAAMAADKLGDKAKATAYYEKLVALADGSGSDRPALAAAKQYLAKN